jgi:release factor glutamine methyltransferase
MGDTDKSPSPSGEGLVRASLAEAARHLTPVSDTPRLDAELLMAHALGISRDALLLGHLDDPVPPGFPALLARRLVHEPVAYITGTRAFWSIELRVGPGVLVPRPDSETLIEAAVTHFAGRPPARILDLGTGPGTLLLAALAEWPEAHGLGIDASERALEYAEDNAIDLEMEERARFKPGDWAKDLHGRFDLILCNPPYIETGARLPAGVRDHEPADALFAGPDGLDAYRVLAPQIARLLAPGGIACIEVGAGQAEAVAAMLAEQGLRTGLRNDLAGIARCVTAQ